MVNNGATGSRAAASAGFFASVAVACSVLYTVKPGTQWFSWHPTLMTIAYGLLTQPAVALLLQKHPLLPDVPRHRRVTLHWILQLTSLSCAAGGTWVVYRNKELHSKPHLVSWHAWLGTTALCFTGTAAALGLWTLWSRRRRPGRHVLAGVLTHCLAVAALAFGLETDYFAALVPTALWRRCFSALAFVSAAAVVAQTRRI